jgi:integrase
MTARKVESLKDGTHGDGGNLWITVTGKSRTWSFRFNSPVTGKRREMGLGPARDVTLAGAREQASTARRLVRQGIDPIEQRRVEKVEQARQNGLTFKAVAERYIEDQKAGWRGSQSAFVWTSSLARLAYPTIGEKAVGDLVTDDIVSILRPIWTTRTETADRLRGRIERVLDYARTQGWREGENPARWRGHLAHILPKPSTVAQVEHHAAIPYRTIAPVMAALARSGGMGAMAVRFACLTAARSGEVRGATWSEMDLAAKVWTVPAERMKTKRAHRVPLSEPALEILNTLKPLTAGKEAHVFPGGRPRQGLTDVALSKALHLAAGTKDVTVHGLRSTFRDWTAEATEYPRDVAEMALAHSIGDKVEAAYRRGDLFEKRRAMMEEWGRFADGSKFAG